MKGVFLNKIVYDIGLKMAQMDLIDIVKLRFCVGYLGEVHQYAWWQSSFLSSTSSPFLTPMFGKTSIYSQYYGVRDAAARVHDTHIGLGKGVFHLFRLPEKNERELHELLGRSENVTITQGLIQNKNQIEQYLKSYSKNNSSNAIGPVRIGDVTDLDKKMIWQSLAHHYLNAFDKRLKVFPYFSGEK